MIAKFHSIKIASLEHGDRIYTKCQGSSTAPKCKVIIRMAMTKTIKKGNNKRNLQKVAECFMFLLYNSLKYQY